MLSLELQFHSKERELGVTMILHGERPLVGYTLWGRRQQISL